MKIALDFPLILTSIVLITGIISLLDVAFLAKKRLASGKEQPRVIEYARSFFPVLLVVLLIRSFIVQPYRVPTGSLEPTVLPGDFIIVNQFAYGLRLPVINTKIVNIGEPKTGDIALFHWPKDPRILFVKRVIGTPGDHIVYKNKALTINDKVMSQKDLGMVLDDEYSVSYPVELKEEQLPNNLTHKIFIHKDSNLDDGFDITVPEGNYFMLGDNRDNSGDSRIWGFMPEENLVGKALGVWMSWDSKNNRIRWERIGKAVK